MLCMNSYPQDYVDQCRSRIDQQLVAYRRLAAAAEAKSDEKLGAAAAAFEPLFFNSLVLVLDSYFVHRSRTIEGKDGNPLNEVRVLCTSMLLHGDIVTVEKAIKLEPDTSVLGMRAGDRVSLSEAAFVGLSKAYFDEIERKFVQPAAARPVV